MDYRELPSTNKARKHAGSCSSISANRSRLQDKKIRRGDENIRRPACAAASGEKCSGGANVRRPYRERGFGLIEILMATGLATIGLLAACQLLLIAMSTASLARSQGAAALFALNKLESLSDFYARDPGNGAVQPGVHGPEEKMVINPNDGSVLNRFQITWAVDPVADPRPGKRLDARRVRVTVTPSLAGGAVHHRPPFNKILNLETVFSVRMQ